MSNKSCPNYISTNYINCVKTSWTDGTKMFGGIGHGSGGNDGSIDNSYGAVVLGRGNPFNISNTYAKLLLKYFCF